jgi:hypothetical protein
MNQATIRKYVFTLYLAKHDGLNTVARFPYESYAHKGRCENLFCDKVNIMDIFAKLAATVLRENTEGDLPDFIVPLLMKVAENPENFKGREELVAELVMRVEQYETWSELCCEKQGFSLEDIHRILDRLKVRY